MVKYEIKAYGLDEAKEKAAKMGLTIVRNVTLSYKAAGEPTNKDFKIFAVEMMEKNKLVQEEGVGLIVVLDQGSKDVRNRPFKYTNNVVEGRRVTKRFYEVRTKDGEFVCECESKGEAAQMAKALMSKYKKDMVGNIVYRVVDDKGPAFNLEYTPSAATKEGTYVVFGNIKSF